MWERGRGAASGGSPSPSFFPPPPYGAGLPAPKIYIYIIYVICNIYVYFYVSYPPLSLQQSMIVESERGGSEWGGKGEGGVEEHKREIISMGYSD